MNRERIFEIFREMNQEGLRALIDYTLNNTPEATEKIDRSVFSGADAVTDQVLCDLAREHGFNPIGEESEHDLEIIRKGDYMTIDSIDGSGLYLQHVKGAKKKRLDPPHVDPDLGDNFDYAIILGIVSNGRPRFGSYFSYVTGETILVDSDSTNHTIWEKGQNENQYSGRITNYVENRVLDVVNEHNTQVNDQISTASERVFNVGPLGRRCLYAQLGGHDSSAVYHMGLQENGLWDILPACVLAATPENMDKTRIYDGNKNPITFTDYAQTPNKGVILTHGPEFEWITRD